MEQEIREITRETTVSEMIHNSSLSKMQISSIKLSITTHLGVDGFQQLSTSFNKTVTQLAEEGKAFDTNIQSFLDEVNEIINGIF